MSTTMRDDGRVEFVPEWAECGQLENANCDVKKEAMLFGADPDFAMEKGGLLTRYFLAAMARAGFFERFARSDCVIDSRVHMLMPGWYPCIPGWHIDDFHRPDGDQPDYLHLPERMVHVLCVVGGCSRTEFLDRSVALLPPAKGAKVYGDFHQQIEAARLNGDVDARAVRPGALVRFGGSDFHRGVPATENGWRWFIRATFGSSRKPGNEIRKQVQVYLPAVNAGW